MSSKLFFIYSLSLLLLFLNSCKKEETIEEIPVSHIEISDPPAPPEPAPPIVSPYQEDGIYKIGDLRFYNAVTPIGAVMLSEDAEESRFYVPNMMSSDINRFLDKYFPYQRKQRFARTDIFEVFPEILPEYADDAIIPTTDPNIIKPIPETAVYIRVFWNHSHNYYEWIYHDPIVRARQQAEEQKAREESNTVPGTQEIPILDSEGNAEPTTFR